jgi:hypothetical protein
MTIDPAPMTSACRRHVASAACSVIAASTASGTSGRGCTATMRINPSKSSGAAYAPPPAATC